MSPNERLLKMFDDAEAWPTVRAAIRQVLVPPEAPRGTKLVLMSEELFIELGADRVEWGEPTIEGWYQPTLYRDTK